MTRYGTWPICAPAVSSEMTGSDIDALISEATKGIADEDTRKARTDTLTAMLQVENSPGPEFPEQWRSEPNVMFETGDPQPEPFEWGERKWATERAYDEDLASFLGELACGRDVPKRRPEASPGARSNLRGHGGRADRLWPRLFAARVIGPDCPPAKGLPEDMRRQLEELAAQGDAAAAPPGLPARSRRVRLCALDRLARGDGDDGRAILPSRNDLRPKPPLTCRPCGRSSGGMPDRGELDADQGI